MLFRFLKYTWEDELDKYAGAKYITGIDIKKDYDTFLSFLKRSKGFDFEVRDTWYSIDDIVLHYNGGEDDRFCCNIYCIEW